MNWYSDWLGAFCLGEYDTYDDATMGLGATTNNDGNAGSSGVRILMYYGMLLYFVLIDWQNKNGIVLSF